jgi:protein kinase A
VLFSLFSLLSLLLENVMIDSKGYPVLIDFGFAKYVVDKTYTLCGTPGYLPPEVILTRGHNCSADYWSLGVLIYEMVTGKNPFYFDGLDQMALFKSIVQGVYEPPQSGSREAADIIAKLLVKDPSRRLGSLARGEPEVFEHAWFRDIDLQALRGREIPGPWIPDLDDPLDTSCFEDWSHLADRTASRFPPIHERDAALFMNF